MTEDEKQKRVEAKKIDRKQQELINQFIEGLKNSDVQKADENLTALKKIKINEYNDHILKAGRLTAMLDLVANDMAQPFLKEYFDMAVKDSFGKSAGCANNLIEWTQQNRESTIFDGNEDIIYFLRAYHIAKKERAAQGKDIFEPESFAYNIFLKDISEGIFRNKDGFIIEKRDYEKDKVSVVEYYEDKYNRTEQIKEKSVYIGEDIGVWGGLYNRIRTEFQHFTKDGKDDTQMELAREKARSRYLHNRYHGSNGAGIGVAAADEIARRQISGEETRIITPKIGEEIRRQVRNKMAEKMNKLHKDHELR